MITIINHLPCLSMDKCYNLIFTARGRRGKPSGWKKRSREQTVIFIFRNSEHFPTMSVFLSGAPSSVLTTNDLTVTCNLVLSCFGRYKTTDSKTARFKGGAFISSVTRKDYLCRRMSTTLLAPHLKCTSCLAPNKYTHPRRTRHALMVKNSRWELLVQ